MARSKGAALAAALLAGTILVAAATQASADPSPQSRDIVGVGSDTSQDALNYIADGYLNGASVIPGYNAAANARLASYNAITINGVTHDNIVLRGGKAPVQRPNGSGEGKTALRTNADVTFARSSSTLNSTEIGAGLVQVPFAVDGLKLAVSAVSTHAPATITPAQMVGIYQGTITSWSQIDASKSGTIVPLVPQSGSGTLSFFTAQLTAANGGTAVTLGANVKTMQEHDETVFSPSNSTVIPGTATTYGSVSADIVAPFSTGRASLNPTLVKVEGGFSARRALYNVVRSADTSTGWFTALFSANGYICSSGAQGAIAAAGFDQLAIADDGGVCGVPMTADTTNFTTN
ncbi:substrate-binding domain-containing protein [Cellulomonas hominis]